MLLAISVKSEVSTSPKKPLTKLSLSVSSITLDSGDIFEKTEYFSNNPPQTELTVPKSPSFNAKDSSIKPSSNNTLEARSLISAAAAFVNVVAITFSGFILPISSFLPCKRSARRWVNK